MNRSALIMVFLCVLCGCGRKSASSDATTPQLTPEQAAQIESQYLPPVDNAARTGVASPSPGPRAPTPQQANRPIQERLNGAIHARLTVQLRMFIEKNGRMPETFSEFANAAMDSAPLAPDGMKFVIDPVDRTVKAVKK
jgi:hypothetical protein